MTELINILNIENGHYGETYEVVSSTEEENIRRLITSYLPNVSITKICIVKNNYLLGMYKLKKAEYKSRYGSSSVQELTMLHTTGECNIDSIIKNNLDWRRVTRNKFGVGVSFSMDADYCNFHCSPNNGTDRVFIVANVLVSEKVAGSSTLRVPHHNADTAIGNNSKVYVKFNDNEFFPKYLVFYRAPERSHSRYWTNRRRR